MTIPARLHFFWIGPKLPWACVFALLSAAARSDMPEIILHHTDALEDDLALRSLGAAPSVRLERLDPHACLARVGGRLGLGDALERLYRGLDSPAARSDVLRAAILYQQGGIYLDLDTIITASLRPLLAARQFVGAEFIVWPLVVRASRSPLVRARHLGLDVLRKALSRLPQGWKAFRRVEHLYFRGVNNAVMGAEPEAPLLAAYLQAMPEVPANRARAPYGLGPDLLQATVDGYRQDDLIIHDPAVFYPLPPRISELWFRIGRCPPLHEVLPAETRVVHWYASVRTKARVALIDPAYVRAHQERQLYSALVCACIPDLPAAS